MKISDNLKNAINECKNGNESAFAILYEESKQYVGTCIFKIFGRDPNIEYIMYDVINDTYFVIWQNIYQLTDDAIFLSWAGMIAIRKCYDYLKKNKGIMPMEQNDLLLENYSESDDIIPDNVIHNAEKQQMVSQVIDTQLSDMERLCLIAYYYNEISQQDIALWLEIPENTVKTYLYRAKVKIKDALLSSEKDKSARLHSITPVMLLLFADEIAAMNLPSGMLNLQYSYAKFLQTAGAAVGADIAGNATGLAAEAVSNAANAMRNATEGMAGSETGKAAGVARRAAVKASGNAAGGAAKKGLLTKIAGLSLKAKIAGGAIAIATVGAVTGGVYVATKKDESPKSGIEVSNDKDAPDEKTQTTTTENATEIETTEASTEEAADPNVYKKAYLEILEKNKSGIEDYKWQHGKSYDNGIWTYKKEATPVAICDITGDDIPELLFMVATSEYTADLYIYTYADDKAKQIYWSENWDAAVAAGVRYYFFKISGENDLYAFHSNGDEGMYYTYYRFGIDSEGMLNITDTWNKDIRPNEDYTADIITCAHNDTEISEKEYNDTESELKNNVSHVLMYNAYTDEYINEYENKAEFLNMTYEEAIEFLGGENQQNVDADNSGSSKVKVVLPDGVSDEEFLFTSGAGAWATSLNLQTDGSFSGSFHDSNMGESGTGYMSTVYVSSFKGSFNKIKKLDEHSYSMKLKKLTCDKEVGEEWIVDQTRYVASEAYGIDGGEEFILYLPGTPMADLPEEAKNWISLFEVGNVDKISGYILYNVEQNTAFWHE